MTTPDRSYSQTAREDKSHGPKMKTAAAALSDGDQSVIIGALKQNDPDTVISTMSGSANDQFWALLANVGLLIDHTDDMDAKLTDHGMVGYKISEEGQRFLPILLQTLFQKYDA